MSLSSRWLDLDRIAGAGEAAGPLDSIIPLAIGMRDLLPAEGRSRATFAIDQANVGREAVSDVRLSLARSEDKLEIEEFRLGLPGGSRGELQGVVSGPPEAPIFDGSLEPARNEPRALPRLGDGQCPVLRRQGRRHVRRPRRSCRSRPGSVAARNIIGDLSGTAIRGDAQYRWEGRPELSLLLESPQLDARAFIPAGSSLGDIFDLVLHGPAARQAAAPDLGTAKPGWRGAQTDALIRVNAGQLITAARTYRDVMMEIELKGGRLRLPLLRVAGDDGFSLELEGEVDECRLAAEGQPARRDRRRFGAGHRTPGGAARHSRSISPRRQAGAGHGAAAPGGIDVVRRAHADLRRSGRSTARSTARA